MISSAGESGQVAAGFKGPLQDNQPEFSTVSIEGRVPQSFAILYIPLGVASLSLRLAILYNIILILRVSSGVAGQKLVILPPTDGQIQLAKSNGIRVMTTSTTVTANSQPIPKSLESSSEAMPVQIESPEKSKPSAIQVYKSSPLPENRPIASANPEISDIFAIVANRPVSSSKIKVMETFSGNRPIFASNLKISDSITVSGNRPIFASTLKISESFSVMGNRPVASNEIDDPESLMGFLD